VCVSVRRDLMSGSQFRNIDSVTSKGNRMIGGKSLTDGLDIRIWAARLGAAKSPCAWDMMDDPRDLLKELSFQGTYRMEIMINGETHLVNG
jgi:hypothetical protein